MKFQMVSPSGILKDYIRHYCFMETGSAEPDIMERVIPMDNVQLMFHYKNPFIVVHENSADMQPRSILSGLTDTFSDVTTHGESGVVFVSFLPAGACHFFRFSLSEIENTSINLSEILYNETRQIEDALYCAGSNEARVHIIEQFLLHHFSPIDAYDRHLLNNGLQLIRRCKGQTSAFGLSEQLATTPKNLERKFSRYLGTTTKQVIKLVRFQEILRDFSEHKNIRLTDRAYNNGYFDQAHFIKDFKSYCGYTPGEFSARYPDFSMNGESC